MIGSERSQPVVAADGRDVCRGSHGSRSPMCASPKGWASWFSQLTLGAFWIGRCRRLSLGLFRDRKGLTDLDIQQIALLAFATLCRPMLIVACAWAFTRGHGDVGGGARRWPKRPTSCSRPTKPARAQRRGWAARCAANSMRSMPGWTARSRGCARWKPCWKTRSPRLTKPAPAPKCGPAPPRPGWPRSASASMPSRGLCPIPRRAPANSWPAARRN